MIFHQGIVDAARSGLLLPLGLSVWECRSLPKCALIGTAFLLLVTVSTVNMLTSVLNDAPVSQEIAAQEQSSATTPTSTDTREPNGGGTTESVNLDSAHCVVFGIFMIWFASFTINLGPTFLSGALASWTEPMDTDKCPLITDSLQHYVLSVLWIFINALCIILTSFHLRKLQRDLTKSRMETVKITGLVASCITLTAKSEANEQKLIQDYIRQMEKQGVARVRMFVILIVAYVLFWAPLSVVLIIKPMLDYPPIAYQIAIHIAFVHSFINPTLLLAMHGGLREAIKTFVCCGYCAPRRPSYGNSLQYGGSTRSSSRNYM